ncbi:hypothetical protein FHU38_004243 [Saccharomonospora amisosensis]|uniref:Cytochrome P450 n=1 Tax=Saccharomonospora amisosensis TaxID=1128677 RepID=A0A7X5ZSF1_9PSEU|nr:hypothetical protein [Saccharomonospora amisosensis]NIJ13899.1 hypothetical protein [Saccharomonospora amisosensis]
MTPAVRTRIRREHGSVAPVLLDGDVPAWFVTGCREVHQVAGARARRRRRRPGRAADRTRLPDLALTVLSESLERQPSVWLRGLTSLPVTFSPVYVQLTRE